MNGDELSLDGLRDLQFGMERRGYDVEVVDQLLAQVRLAVQTGRPPADALPTRALPTSRRGYRTAEVDALLARIRAWHPELPEVPPTTTLLEAPALRLPQTVWTDRAAPYDILDGFHRPVGQLRVPPGRHSAAQREQAIYDADDALVAHLVVRERRFSVSRDWDVLDASGSPFGAIRTRGVRGVVHLEADGATVAEASHGRNGGVDPYLRIHDATGTEVARVVARPAALVGPDEPAVEVDYLAAIATPLRILILAFAVSWRTGAGESAVPIT